MIDNGYQRAEFLTFLTAESKVILQYHELISNCPATDPPKGYIKAKVGSIGQPSV